MKILKIETNGEVEKSLVALIDLALKTSGIAALQHTNVILNSIQDVTDEKVNASEIISTENQYDKSTSIDT